MSRVRTRLEQYKQELERQTQYKAGLPGSALDIVNTLLLDLKEDEESTGTDQEAIKAINTISRFTLGALVGAFGILLWAARAGGKRK